MGTFDTVFPADSLEFCPTIGFQDLFVCGTYKLLDQANLGESTDSKLPQKRIGQCLAFKATSDDTGDLRLYVPRIL